MNVQNLDGKRVVITGGSQGLGLAMVGGGLREDGCQHRGACHANVMARSCVQRRWENKSPSRLAIRVTYTASPTAFAMKLISCRST